MSDARTPFLGRFGRSRRFGGACALIAVWMAMLLPGVHGWTGCDDCDEAEATPGAISCHDDCDGRHECDPGTTSTPGHHHHDSESCELCRQILIVQHGIAPTIDAYFTPAGLVEIDNSALSAQRPESVGHARLRRSRGPPTNA